jgi:hypothetical protein
VAEKSSQRKAQVAWERIESLGGHGVFERDLCMVSLAGTAVTDEELSLFQDLPDVRFLVLSHTGVGDAGLAHLGGLHALEELVIVDTRISAKAIKAFQRSHPAVTITTEARPQGDLNPFTGKPF